jgi:formylglycine-generating enzyme required for sulfatase activity
MTHDAFVSSTPGDWEVAASIAKGLEAGGLSCWQAPQDLRPEDDVQVATNRAISACKVFILVLSGATRYSSQALQERRFAASKKIVAIHFRVDDSLLEDIQDGHHWLNARGNPLDLSIDTLEKAIKRIIWPKLYANPCIDVQSKINTVDGAEMIFIAPGEFIMGSDEVYYDRDGQNRLEGGSQTRFQEGYFIYKNLVTVSMFERFCSLTNHSMPNPPRWGWDVTDYPMVNVSWDDAVAYATWAGVELPTSAQWEKAARGTDGLRFPWGNDWDPTRCWNNASAFKAGRPVSVGSFPEGASPYGVLDMTGSVSQWCSDWLQSGYYMGKLRNVRGSAFYSDSDYDFLCAMRSANAPTATYYGRGFRCAASL